MSKVMMKVMRREIHGQQIKVMRREKHGQQIKVMQRKFKVNRSRSREGNLRSTD